MKNYLILDFSITDVTAFMEYVHKIPEFLSKHNGRYLIEGTTPKVIEGIWQPDKIVVLEFETEQHANNFLSDADVKKLFEIRHKATDSNLIQVSGGSWRDELPPVE
jgi:uncharacterized protein (DUF1330 family)